MTPDQLKIRELEKRIKQIELEKEILKRQHSLDVGLAEQFTIIAQLKQSYAVVQFCRVFEVHRSSFKYWKKPKPIQPEQVVRLSKVRELFDASQAHIPTQGDHLITR